MGGQMAYAGLGAVYDMFMDNVPYREWSGRIVSLLQGYGIRDGLVLDLGCGTGKMTRLLAEAGYDMIGVDSSEEMLGIAREEQLAGEGGRDILYLQQDMREFELYGTVRAIVSVCDALNYLLEEESLLAVFKLANNYLDPGGIFLFDMNAIYKYQEVLGETVICENREEASFIWENYYDANEQVNQYDLTLFVREEGAGAPGDALYRKYEETHFQRGYEKERVRQLLEQAGMEFLAAYDGYAGNPAREDSERILFVARERGKRGAFGLSREQGKRGADKGSE